MLLRGRRIPIPPFKIGLVAGLVLSLLVGVLCYYIAATTIERDNEERFRNMARTGQYNINALIKSYTDMVRASVSLFQTNEEITRDQFHRFVAGLNLPKYFPAIETMNYIQWITDEQRDAFEQRIRREDARAKDGRPPFQITPPGRRPDYSIVLYIEPNPLWKQAVGIDLNAQPLINKTLADARDTGGIGTSGSPIKAMKTRNRVGLGMRLPVYHANAKLDTVEQRRAAYIGSVGIAFNVGRLVQGVLEELPLRDARLRIFNRIDTVAAREAGPIQLLFDSSATATKTAPPSEKSDGNTYSVTLPVDFNGRHWSANFSVPKRVLYRSSDESFQWMAMLTGFTTTMLLYSLYYVLTSSRRRAIELAKGMTRELRESQAQLLQSHENLRLLTAHAEHIKESERKRIAREIHDDLGQNLLALRIDAQMLSSRTGKQARLHARAESTLSQIDATIKSVRQIINDLRPNVLDLGLNAAVDWQIDQFRRRTGIKCELVEYHADIAVSDHCATALFRILQESLSNVIRHSAANWVRVDLRVDDGHVWMSVHDNGVGLAKDRGRKAGRFGLIGIEERVRILGGRFSLRSSPDHGTTVEVAIPTDSAEPSEAQANRPGLVHDYDKVA
jgi:signal transduction histidine kinase